MKSIITAAIAASLTSVVPATAQQDSVFAVSRGGASLLRVNADGNVGIGNSQPTDRLTVKGGVRADSLAVAQVRFSDGSSVSTVLMSPAAIPFASGWANLGATWLPGSYFKDPMGVVHLSGTLRFSNAAAYHPLLGTLPPGYRPAARAIFPAYASYASAYVFVDPDGSIYAGNLAGNVPQMAVVTLDAVQFLATQ
jgi:hypothetical protein